MREQEDAMINPALPSKKYQVLYADPPWQYNASENLAKKSLLSKTQSEPYQTIQPKRIKDFDVMGLAEDDALLFLWVVSPMLPEGLDVMRAWGFNFATIGFVWHKQAINPGYYTLSSVELCLVGKRGRIPTPRGARNIEQFLSEKRGKHSEKPNEVRRRIAEMFPTQSKIELFARHQPDGWDVFGNETRKGMELFDNDSVQLEGAINE